MTQTLKIALIGGGHMGGALASGWLRTKRSGVSADSLTIVDPSPGEPVQNLVEKHGVRCVAELDAADAAGMDLIVLAVKPQTLEAVAAPLAPMLSKDAALVSIMAGVTLNRLAMAFGDRPIVRVMPNMPASVGAGVSVCVANEAGEAFEKTANKLFKPVGSVEWVKDERLIGAVTAVSGSGPAYVFLLAEALAGAGTAEGLPRELAEKLARETIIGAGALLASSDKSPQELRRSITSPGGTTQAALDALMGSGGGLPELVRNAVNAAERRSRQLGNGNGR
ncbi:pyrroline-5-carboxylate reductase [Maricaulis parjimensis]|uniref:pyrroline-5-carboxylate reductase n=1 Tax=Maricaulis parjimensis TaxID=144023 RepID=UPI00193AA245|nr:pyrroline-5-carboxylate reductase [Maricaulis parjimensis]